MTETDFIPPIGDTVVLLPSCDAFADVHPVALECLSRYWPDRPWPLVCISNRKPWGDYPILTWDDKGWRENLMLALDRLPNVKFVLMLLDDMLHCREVCQDSLNEAMWIMRGPFIPQIGALRVGQTGGDIPIRGEPGVVLKFAQISPESPYYVSTGPTIWRVPFLRKILENIKGSTAWDFEIQGTAFARTCEEEIYMPVGREEDRPIRCFYTGITRGKWNRGCLNWLAEIGIEQPDLTRGVIEDNDRRPM
jgi:hypothetical protein